MRKRYGLLLREEVTAPLAEDGDVDDELRYCMQAASDS
jgi:hypothetical protein